MWQWKIDVGGQELEACREGKIVEAKEQVENEDVLIESMKVDGEERNMVTL